MDASPAPVRTSGILLACGALLAILLACALYPIAAHADAVEPFKVSGPEESYSWDGPTLVISGDGVTIEGMANPDAPAGAVVVEANVKTVGIGADVHISTLTVKRSTTFVVSGAGNKVVKFDTARDDAVGGDGRITMDTGQAGIDVFDSAVVRVDGQILSASVWQKATLVLGPKAHVDGIITALGGILDLSQVVIDEPVSVGGVSVGNENVTLAVAAPFGATSLHQLLDYKTLIVNDPTPVYENGERIGTLNADGSFEITATRTVTFLGFDGTPLATEEVRLFSAATAPEAIAPDGYRFTGWDRPFDYVTEDMTVAARFEKLPAPEPEPEPEPTPEPEPEPEPTPEPQPEPNPEPSIPPAERPGDGTPICPNSSASAGGRVQTTQRETEHVRTASQQRLAKTGDGGALAAVGMIAGGAFATLAIAAVAGTRKRRDNH